ncbi:MAG: ABC transporter ATP-binding protein, partial [Oscillospiraceae bacterium]|nr:ABC transporter ATP-binding protein [Oscillospiraceae bacterium]
MCKEKGTEKAKKEKNQITRETLLFMLRLVWQKKPSLFIMYALYIIIGFGYGLLDVIMPKFIIDEAAAIIGGGGGEHIRKAIFYVGFFVVVHTFFNMANNIIMHYTNIAKEWFNEYIDVQIGDHAMAMDFENTENPEALDTLQKAKEGMDWYSGGVCGIMDSFVFMIQQAALLCGVSVVILFTCPLLLPVQIISLIIISIFNAKNNEIQKASFLKLAKNNRIFGYVMYELADFRLGKDIRLYESADMMCKKAEHFSDMQSKEWIDQEAKSCKNSWVMDFVNSFRDGISYFYIGFLALTKAITIGEFSMCVSGSSTFYWSLHRIITGIQDISKRCDYAHKYIEFMDYPAAMVKGDKPVKD